MTEKPEQTKALTGGATPRVRPLEEKGAKPITTVPRPKILPTGGTGVGKSE